MTHKYHTDLQRKYHPRHATPIDKIEFNYSLSKKPTTASTNAVALQFPLKLAFAATAHKVQGATIKKPNKLVIDLRTVRQASQAYVMLSRIQALSQLIILVSVCANKLYASELALQETERMERVATNNKHDNVIVVSCNIRSISANFEGFISTPNIKDAEVICLQETWLCDDFSDCFEIEGFEREINSVGRGKGIITFYKPVYTTSINVKSDKYQMTKMISETQDIIHIYRSIGASSAEFLNDLDKMFDSKKVTYLLGDFNLCFKTESDHPILKKVSQLGFKQKVEHATHLAGRLIDHIYIFSPCNQKKIVKIQQQSPYFSDHDILSVIEVSYFTYNSSLDLY